jgi:hypothetical protein
MFVRAAGRMLVVASIALCAIAAPAESQILTGTVSGTVKDAQGGVIPGATVTRQRVARHQVHASDHHSTGDSSFPASPPTPTWLEVTMPSFKMLQRKGLVVSAGTRVRRRPGHRSRWRERDRRSQGRDAPDPGHDRRAVVPTAASNQVENCRSADAVSPLSPSYPGVSGTADLGAAAATTTR